MPASWSGKVAIVGAYESPRRRAPGVHPFAIQAECARGALADAGLEPADVDGLATAASFPAEGAREMAVAEVAEYLGLRTPAIDDIAVIAFLAFERALVGPVYPGDLITARWTVSQVRRSRSKPDRGIVCRQVAVVNQDGAIVQRGSDTYLAAARQRAQDASAHWTVTG